MSQQETVGQFPSPLPNVGEALKEQPPSLPDAHRLERRRFYLAAELYVHGGDEQHASGKLPAERALRYADDLLLEHLQSLDKFLDRVRESAKENADA